MEGAYEVMLKEDTKVLAPNRERKNFSETNEVILKGSLVKGCDKQIQGTRKGKPFVFKLFLTEDHKLIQLNKTQPKQNNDNMEKTEVTLGADGGSPKTIINLTSGDIFAKNKLIAAAVGAVVAFGYSKYKKHDNAKCLKRAALGALAGYLALVVYGQIKGDTVKKTL